VQCNKVSASAGVLDSYSYHAITANFRSSRLYVQRDLAEAAERRFQVVDNIGILCTRPSSLIGSQFSQSAGRSRRSEAVVDPVYIGRALQWLTAEVAGLRDDMHVLTAVVQCLDKSQGRMLEELRAMHRQQSRFGERLGQLEEQR
jgi:hypothetical protein